ncbi:MAG: ligase-associated DNA damage response endonuclease PdeM [Sediminicola sp.]|tara:strand:- start:58589 stop:59227 length:639 start_codon:yes stop_codon:yes gene_type:complete
MTLRLQITDQHFILHTTGALFWEERSMLLISDAHLGKISHFRKHGAAVPQMAIQKNFSALNALLEQFSPKTTCFLGDLFHSNKNGEWSLFRKWALVAPTQLLLVMGNHDIISQNHYLDLGMEVMDELLLFPFLLTHHPEERQGHFNMAGHVHPAVKLKGSGRQYLKLPCFFKRPHQMILPAFGEFTGTHAIKPKEGDEVFVLTPEKVIKIDC